MAAQRKAIWDDATWNAPPETLTERPPNHMYLVALKAQAEAMKEIAILDFEAVVEGLVAYETLSHLVRPPEQLLAARLAGDETFALDRE